MVLSPKALRLETSDIVAFVGAGGKTTAMFQLARAFLASVPRVLLTTTTHLSIEQVAAADHHAVLIDREEASAFWVGHPEGVLAVTGDPSGDRFSGVSPAVLSHLAALAREAEVPILVEADGSRTLPLKAPDFHEPPIPDYVNVVIVCVGGRGIGQPLSERIVHRPEIFSRLTGIPLQGEITLQSIGELLTHPEGGFKNIPSQARRVALINQMDTPQERSLGRRLAEKLLDPYETVLLCALESEGVLSRVERAAGVILAAGGSMRMGQPKPLLDWGGMPLVRHVVGIAQASRLSPIIVVTGAAGEQVRAALTGFEVEMCHNEAWEAGQSTSVRKGVEAIPPGIGCGIFFLVDQPWVSPELVQMLVAEHRLGMDPIVAPLIDGQRGNPVLFDRSTFPDFEKLMGDQGGRQLFGRHPVRWVPWHDAAPLRDLDTPEAYHRWRPSQE